MFSAEGMQNSRKKKEVEEFSYLFLEGSICDIKVAGDSGIQIHFSG